MAKGMPGAALTTLSHHIDLDFLREAHRRTRKDGAAGVDERTAKEYAKELDENLAVLLEQFKAGTYWAPPVRRVHIPKGDGTKTRPIGIPTFEDKVLQRAVTMVMEAVYEQEFLDCSWGFRPGRSAHGALEALREGISKVRGPTLHSSRPRAVRRPAASAARPARRVASRLWVVKARGG